MSNNFAEAAMDSATEATSKVLSPVERLELSRARIRVFLDRRKPAAGAASTGFTASSVGAKVAEWAEGLRANPLTGAVVDAVRNWWATHPLHTAALIAADTVEELAVPWIRRYPLGVVAGALAFGVIGARIKPWRWLGKPALFAGLASQVAAQLLTHAPLEFLINAFSSFAKRKDPTRSAPPDGVVDEPGFSDTVPGVDPVSSVVPPLNAVHTSRTPEPIGAP